MRRPGIIPRALALGLALLSGTPAAPAVTPAVEEAVGEESRDGEALEARQGQGIEPAQAEPPRAPPAASFTPSERIDADRSVAFPVDI